MLGVIIGKAGMGHTYGGALFYLDSFFVNLKLS
jgi:hypothetical protein